MQAIRCSSLDRALACPASLLLESLVAPSPSGDDGVEGSALHHASSVRIVSELGGSAPDGLPAPDPSWPSLRFSRWISDYYVRHIQENCPSDYSLETEIPLAYSFTFPAPVPITVVEWVNGAPVVTQKIEHGFILSGHIDCCAISPDGTKAIIWDLKTGYDPVDAADSNWQMIGYFALLLRAYPSLNEVLVYIVQPRNDEDQGFERVSECRLGMDVDLQAVSRSFVQTVATALALGELNSGQKQCRWCPRNVKLQCPAYEAERDFMKMQLTAENLAAIRATPDDTRIADWLLSVKMLKPGFDEVESLAKERIAAAGGIAASDGTVIEVKTTKGSYDCHDRAGMYAAVKELLPEERLALAAKFSMTELRAQVSEHMGVPLSGKGAMTATGIVDAKTSAFQTQGVRESFVFKR